MKNNRAHFCTSIIVPPLLVNRGEVEEEEEEEKEEEEKEKKKKKKKKKKKEEHFGRLATFWFGTFRMLFVPVGVLFIIKYLMNGRLL